MSGLMIVIAECPYCGCHRYSWEEEDALYKLSKHQCSATLLDQEITEILDRILENPLTDQSKPPRI